MTLDDALVPPPESFIKRFDQLPDNPDFDTLDCEHPCVECETVIPWNSNLYKLWRCPICDDCSAAEELRSKVEESRSKQLSPIESLIPPLYLDHNPKLLPEDARRHLGAVLSWNPGGDKGLYLLGASRAGKTRCLTRLLAKLHSQGIRFKAFFPGEFHAELVAAKRSKGYIDWFNDITSVPVLAIDDLFSEKLTSTTEAGYFEVLDKRISYKRPTLITTQVRTSDTKSLFENPLRGHALMARLRETSDVFAFNDALQDQLKV